MATYAIGDVHGCYRELKRLLKKLPFDSDRDRLWLVGDLVNRGPQSLEVLRWARKRSKKMGKRFQVVLGNHDLHLLATAAGLRRPQANDTFDAVLAADDRKRLLRWLRERPLLYRRKKVVLLHAGLMPGWSIDKATDLAERAERKLRSGDPDALAVLLGLRRPKGKPAKHTRSSEALRALTRLRTLRPNGLPCNYSGPPESAPNGCTPWFAVPRRRTRKLTIVCGHWAALGLRQQKGLVALDTGCAWGGQLTAARLEDGTLYQQPALTRVPAE